MIKQKKGIQLSQAFPAVLTIILVAILVIISIYIFSTLGTSMMATGTAGEGVNESITTPTSATGTNLSANILTNGACGAITAIYNGTNGIAMNIAGNFTQTGCNLVNKTSMSPYSTTMLVNYPYTYTATTTASNASTSMVTQFATYPALIGLVGTIIFLALVIGVLVASFMFGGKKGV
jgi:hypothetical protein